MPKSAMETENEVSKSKEGKKERKNPDVELLEAVSEHSGVKYFSEGVPLFWKVRSLSNGQSFGEMALLQNQKRTATVIAETDVSLLVLEKNDFRKILTALISKKASKMKILKEIFNGIPEKTMERVCYTFNEVSFRSSGTPVFRKGEQADGVYFVINGEVQIFSDLKGETEDSRDRREIQTNQKRIPILAKKQNEKTAKTRSALAFLGFGGVFGLEECLTKEKNIRDYWAITSQMNCFFYKISKFDIFEVISKHFPTVFEIIQSRSSRINECHQERRKSIRRMAETQEETRKKEELLEVCHQLIRKPKSKVEINQNDQKTKNKRKNRDIPLKNNKRKSKNEPKQGDFSRKPVAIDKFEDISSADKLKGSPKESRQQTILKEDEEMSEVSVLKGFPKATGSFGAREDDEISNISPGLKPNYPRKASLFKGSPRNLRVIIQDKETKGILYPYQPSPKLTRRSVREDLEKSSNQEFLIDSPVFLKSSWGRERKKSEFKSGRKAFSVLETPPQAEPPSALEAKERLMGSHESLEKSKAGKPRHKKTQSLGSDPLMPSAHFKKSKNETRINSVESESKAISKCMKVIENRLGIELESTISGTRQIFQTILQGMDKMDEEAKMEKALRVFFGTKENEEKVRNKIFKRIYARGNLKMATHNYLNAASRKNSIEDLLESVMNPIKMKKNIEENGDHAVQKPKGIVNHHTHPLGAFTNSCSAFKRQEIQKSKKNFFATEQNQTNTSNDGNKVREEQALNENLKINKLTTEESRNMKLGGKSPSLWSTGTFFVGSFDTRNERKKNRNIHNNSMKTIPSQIGPEISLKERIKPVNLLGPSQGLFFNEESNQIKKYFFQNETKHNEIPSRNCQAIMEPIKKKQTRLRKSSWQRMSMPNPSGFFKDPISKK